MPVDHASIHSNAKLASNFARTKGFRRVDSFVRTMPEDMNDAIVEAIENVERPVARAKDIAEQVSIGTF